MTDPIEHRDDCTGPDLHAFRGRLGDLLARCRGCGRVTAVTEDEAQAVRDTARPAASLAIPPMPYPRSAEWPTHKARARGRKNRRHRKETTA